MEIRFFCPRWGSENIEWKDFFQKIKQAGYDGVEFGISRDVAASALDEIFSLAEQNNSLLICQHYDTYEGEYAEHFDLYAAWLEKMKAFKPVFINSQTGKDFFSFEENKSLIEAAKNFTVETGIEIYHETHRNKFSFAAHITKEYLEKMPGLQITLDASHWVCVAESFLEDQQAAMQMAIERTEHIHARVGYTESPQVPDPRAVEWQPALEAHMRWWEKIASRKKKEDAVLTITPEFGPFPYMVPLPYTNEPITNQWDVNVYMMQVLRNKFE